MNTAIKKIEPFQVKGIKIRTKNSDEINLATAKISALWERFSVEVLPCFVSTSKAPYPEPYGVYFNYESDAAGAFDVMAGIRTDEPPSHKQNTILVKDGTYLVFHAKGEMPLALIDCWARIQSYFIDPKCSYTRLGITDFEQYAASDEALVHIGIQDFD